MLTNRTFTTSAYNLEANKHKARASKPRRTPRANVRQDVPTFTLVVANDNMPAPHDPLDYEDFDPAAMPADAYFADDTPMDVCAFMGLHDAH